MGTYRVLIFEGRARQSIPLARAFKEMGCVVTALCESKLDVCYASRFVDEKIIGVCNNSDETGTLDQLLSIIQNNDYDLIVPTTDFAAKVLSKYKDIIMPYSCVAANDWGIHQIAMDKNLTMKKCSELNLPCPRTMFDVRSLNDFKNISFPIIIKPKESYGAIGFKIIDSIGDLEITIKKLNNDFSNYVFQEYIPQTDLQFECAMFLDENNEVKTALVFSKNRWFPVEGGSSTLNITVDYPEIVKSCSTLLQSINWRGAADIDLIYDSRDGKAKIMEINPRVSGSVKIAFLAGVNIALQMKQLAEEVCVTNFDDYRIGLRLRCLQTDCLWFIKSPLRFKAKPSWFSWKNTKEQLFYIDDPLPWFAFSLKGLFTLRTEIGKRS